MIYEPDKEALQKLIDRFYDGGPLNKFLDGLEKPVREAAKLALMQGFQKGEGSRAIAKRLNDATGIGNDRAMTIVQTETNQAYKAASLDFYRGAGIQQYVWMSALDPRTCATCWSLHGQVFSATSKPRRHRGCRCTVIPVIRGMKEIETGERRFAKLEPGYQKQILGNRRFEQYKSGLKLTDVIEQSRRKR